MRRSRLAAELVGTFALVFAGTGSIVVDDLTGGEVTHVGVALSFGLVVLAMVCAFGSTSGAHLNPAVTIGLAAARRFPSREALPYVASQCAGAILASLALRALFPAHATLGATEPAGAAAASLALEGIFTFLLMMAILRAPAGANGGYLPVAVAAGAAVCLGSLVAGPISGASLNPARSLGPAIVALRLPSLWIYVAGPTLGALAAVLLAAAFQATPPPPLPSPEATRAR